MGEKTGIQWCDHTFNPWWGCSKVSPACDHCYAEREAIRFGYRNLWGLNSSRRFFQQKHWDEPIKWNQQAKQDDHAHLVFCGSMCDFLEGNVAHLNLAFERAMLFHLIIDTPYLFWLLLTKRPENFDLLPSYIKKHPHKLIGITCENQEMFNTRLEICKSFDIHPFISIEPMLEPISISSSDFEFIRWIIVGGESGPKSRLTGLDWVRSIQRECSLAHKPFFFKQWGSIPPSGQLEGMLDGVEYHEFPNFE